MLQSQSSIPILTLSIVCESHPSQAHWSWSEPVWSERFSSTKPKCAERSRSMWVRCLTTWWSGKRERSRISSNHPLCKLDVIEDAALQLREKRASSYQKD